MRKNSFDVKESVWFKVIFIYVSATWIKVYIYLPGKIILPGNMNDR